MLRECSPLTADGTTLASHAPPRTHNKRRGARNDRGELRHDRRRFMAVTIQAAAAVVVVAVAVTVKVAPRARANLNCPTAAPAGRRDSPAAGWRRVTANGGRRVAAAVLRVMLGGAETAEHAGVAPIAIRCGVRRSHPGRNKSQSSQRASVPRTAGDEGHRGIGACWVVRLP